jgi:hypothetical protein
VLWSQEMGWRAMWLRCGDIVFLEWHQRSWERLVVVEVVIGCRCFADVESF